MPSFAVSTTGLDALFREMSELSGIEVPKLIRRRAGLLARVCASFTQPVVDESTGLAIGQDGAENASGLTPAARNLGKSAVVRDVGRVYVPVSAVFKEIDDKVGKQVAKAFRKLMTTNPEKAAKLLTSARLRASEVIEWDGGTRHKQLRNKQGRINKGTKPVVVRDTAAIRAYQKKKQDKVGFAKSTWTNAAKMIPDAEGLSKVPMWIKKQNGPGRGIDRTQGNTNQPHIILESQLPWMQDAFGARVDGQITTMFSNLIAKDLFNAIAYLKKKAASNSSARKAA